MEPTEEVWAEIEEAPGYVVSNLGNVRSTRSDRLIKMQVPKRGTVYAPLFVDGVQLNLPVKRLVASAFLEAPDRNCNTPINKDGDATNNRVTNLAWRPRWYAINYARQFANPSNVEGVGPVFVVGTDEVFDTVRDAGIHYGLLFREVYKAVYHEQPVYPLGISFRIPHSIQVRE